MMEMERKPEDKQASMWGKQVASVSGPVFGKSKDTLLLSIKKQEPGDIGS